MDTKIQNVVTRFAPSPTGFLHMGGLRTALFAYLFAKQNGGKFILRIEDTDKARNKEEWTDGLISDLAWLGLNHDYFAKQSERTEIYKKYLQKLITDGYAYISKETPTEVGQRDEVIRFKNPNKKVIFSDIIRGQIEVDTTDLGDFIIARSIDEPLYHLAVVVDDFEMGATYIIRAEEHISNTPRQLLIQEAIGAPRPIYAHLPLVLAEDRSKLSKRKHGETVSLTYYRNLGYLPQAIVNFIALIGWNPGDDKEIMSMDELIRLFKLDKVQKGGGIFNVTKLNWINKEYIKKMSNDSLENEILSRLPEEIKSSANFEEIFPKLLPIIVERIEKFSDINSMVQAGEIEYYFSAPRYQKELLKNTAHILKTVEILKNIDKKEFTVDNVKNALWDFATEVGRGEVLWPMRVALSGKQKSPDPFTLAYVLGKEETIKRLNQALSL